MSKLWLPTDPAGLPPAPRAPAIFDSRRHRNVGQPGVELSTDAWDNRLIATAVELGMPRGLAEQARTHPPARFHLLTLWCLVQDAAEGDAAALEALDRERVKLANVQAGRPGEIWAAYEQPADPAELQRLAGLD